MTNTEIIAIGTELLLGEIVDTNTSFLARQCRLHGIDLFRTQMVGDNEVRITQVIQEALLRTDIIITTGGLGPTVDDPTRKAIADACDRELVFHSESWAQICARIERSGRKPSDNQKRQAYIPRDAIVIPNPVGTAPGFIVELKSPGKPFKMVIALPGVPAEMETLFCERAIPYLYEKFQLKDTILIRTLHTSGMGEGTLDEIIGEFETFANPTVGLSAKSGIVDIRITAKVHGASQADNVIVSLEHKIRGMLGDVIFGCDSDTLELVTMRELSKTAGRLVCLESNMGGALLDRLAAVHSDQYLAGHKHDPSTDLGQSLHDLMCEFACDYGIGVHLNPPGSWRTATFIIHTPKGIYEHSQTLGGPPEDANQWAANMALDYLRHTLKGSA